MDFLEAGISSGLTDDGLLLDTFSLEKAFSFTTFSLVGSFSLAETLLEAVSRKPEDDDEEFELE